jgi:citrate lyase subunit beta/citryl-CoA lyase
MHALEGIRSYLFVPASDPRRVDKALAGDAHAVIVDLEDAVAEGAKDAARRLVSERLREPRARGAQLVRVNGLATEHARADLEAVGGLALEGIVVPKAEPAALAALAPDGPPVVALVETAGGLRRAFETASLARVAALMLGVVDLAAELGATPGPDGRELLYARSALVVDSVAAGLGGPIDGPCTAIGDEAALRAETAAAKALGFAAKACIHPAQLPVVHAVLAPSAEDLDWARRVVAAAGDASAAGRGAVALDGRMVDAPVVARARRLLADAEAGGPPGGER